MNDKDFLQKVAGKTAHGNMGPISVEYNWAEDGKTIAVSMFGSDKPNIFTLVRTNDENNAVYLGPSMFGKPTETDVCLDAENSGLFSKSLRFTFE
ncbi:MAG: hypothetical protein R3Y36_05105 [Spirochaetales bacterium]